MRQSYLEAYKGGEGELVEKKSRFIATVRPVKSEAEAAAFIEEMRKKYWNASHNCTAFCVGRNNELTRCSDDGEPGGTAGRPMLDVLLGEGIHNVCVVVTRYFGGTLLGTGGLVRAYSGAVKEGLKNSIVLDKRPGREAAVTCDYNGLGKLQYIAGQMKLPVLDIQYTDIVAARLMLPEADVDAFVKKVTEATNGKAVIELLGTPYYADNDGELLIFEE
ncbi:YigZ family protein [Fusibacillus kribbianus]|uniref:YigZ family protein n=1 Tax=Fusibacillus kribbianus TaxID=3044208 RepID=A0AAP4EYJ0_9FIRM|nr:YigZ family protein [Ruminococcus sp. YH-rum2234]MDI9242997.1 YigZ family protein [Ruminococcus sp. YH-rum2234]